jgi:hypothetical protein
MSKTSPKWTPEDYEKHVSKLVESLAPADDLLAFVRKHAPASAMTEKMPYALISPEAAPGCVATIIVEPAMYMRPLHMLLSEETAANFDLSAWQIGNVAQIDVLPRGTLPLETFSVKYAADMKDPQKFLSLQEWTHPKMFPGCKMFMLVLNRSSRALSFRGVLWASVSMSEF